MVKRYCCEFDSCSARRIHHEQPDTPRGKQTIEVEDDRDCPVFCSLTCAMMAGMMSVKANDPTVGIERFEERYPDWRQRWIVK